MINTEVWSIPNIPTPGWYMIRREPIKYLFWFFIQNLGTDHTPVHVDHSPWRSLTFSISSYQISILTSPWSIHTLRPGGVVTGNGLAYGLSTNISTSNYMYIHVDVCTTNTESPAITRAFYAAPTLIHVATPDPPAPKAAQSPKMARAITQRNVLYCIVLYPIVIV